MGSINTFYKILVFGQKMLLKCHPAHIVEEDELNKDISWHLN